MHYKPRDCIRSDLKLPTFSRNGCDGNCIEDWYVSSSSINGISHGKSKLYPRLFRSEYIYLVLTFVYFPCFNDIYSGQDVRNVKIGDRVYATSRQDGGTGGLSEVVVVPESSVWKVPENVDLSCCANIGRNYFAAYHSLKTIGNVDDRSLVLVDGASGGESLLLSYLAFTYYTYLHDHWKQA